MGDYLGEETAPFVMTSLLVGTFAAAALVMALLGIYSMTAFVVRRRVRDLGVRVALGATRGRIVVLVLLWPSLAATRIDAAAVLRAD